MGTTVKGKAQVIKRYFNSWIVPNFKDFEDTFSKNASYSECYSPIGQKSYLLRSTLIFLKSVSLPIFILKLI